jgi:hypothetical protein
VSARLAVSMALSDDWEAFGAPSPTVLRWRWRRDGAVRAAASLETLAGREATPEEFAAAASTSPDAWRREVAVEQDTVPPRVVIHDLAPTTTTATSQLRRSASVTWFLDDGSCLQLTLVTADLLALGDLGDAVRILADSVRWEAVA